MSDQERYGHLAWWCEASDTAADQLRDLLAELAEQKATNLALAERLAACSAVLSRAAERGKVCECQKQGGAE